MARVTGFTVNYATSDFNPGNASPEGDDAGITIRGTYQTSGTGDLTGTGDLFVRVQQGNLYDTLPGTFKFFSDGTFTFNASQQDLKDLEIDNGIGKGDTVTFVFRDANGSSPTITLLTTAPVTIYCFYPGTMIATPDGEIAVEDLSIGDLVTLQDGRAAAIRWMGRNTVSMLFADRMKSLPVRIRKDALGVNVPARDLLVSPDHAIFVDGVLAQAGALVNGTSIVRETDVPAKFVYHHIELAEHALVMAENTPAESFVDNVDRSAYDNWAEHEALFGDQPALVEMDLPRAKSQRQVPLSIRQRLAARAVELGYAADAAA